MFKEIFDAAFDDDGVKIEQIKREMIAIQELLDLRIFLISGTHILHE
jgi:hypothetical protein